MPEERKIFHVRRGVTAIAAVATVVALGGCEATQPTTDATAATPAASGAAPADSEASRPANRVSVLGAGDILLHPPLWEQARRDGGGRLDFTPVLTPAMATISQADLALCHLETPVATPSGPYAGFPQFNVPPQVLPAIRNVGFDGCSTASNHSLDRGYEGIKRTLDAMDAARLGHAGTYRTVAESRQPKIYLANDVRVAHLSYATGFNGLHRPAGKSWVANVISPAKIRADAAAARSAGAEIVVVSLHWGTEYAHQPDAGQQANARQIAALRDVDLVLGHHAHVVQPIERRSGKWVVYGMGNQLARHAEPVNANRDGAMVQATFRPTGTTRRWKVTAIEAIPTFVDLSSDIRLVDLDRALADPNTSPRQRQAYRAAVQRIRGHLLSLGADKSGLVVRGSGR